MLLVLRCLGRLLRAAAVAALEDPDLPRLLEMREQFSMAGVGVWLLPCCAWCCSTVPCWSGIWEQIVPSSLVWQRSSGSWDLYEGPDAAWLLGLEQLSSGSWGLWDGSRLSCLAVLSAASSEMALEAVRGGGRSAGGTCSPR